MVSFPASFALLSSFILSFNTIEYKKIAVDLIWRAELWGWSLIMSLLLKPLDQASRPGQGTL